VNNKLAAAAACYRQQASCTATCRERTFGPRKLLALQVVLHLRQTNYRGGKMTGHTQLPFGCAARS